MPTHHHGQASRPQTSPPGRGRRLGLLLGAATAGALGVALIAPHASATTSIPSDAAAQAAAAGILSTGRAASRGEVRRPIADQDSGQGLPAAQAADALAQTRVRALNDPHNHPRVGSAAAPPSIARTSAIGPTARKQRATPPSASDVSTESPPSAGPAGPNAYRAYARSKVSTSQFACLDVLWTKESGWRSTARNPYSTAYGIPQLLDSTWAATGIAMTSNGYRQVDAGLIYITAAYGSPCAAWAHSRATNWY